MVRNANKDIQVYPSNVRPNPSTLVVPSSINTIGEPYSGHSIEESSSVNKGKKKSYGGYRRPLKKHEEKFFL